MIQDIVGKKYQVLDDGFVRLVDYMGNDSAIVQAARVSYGAGTTQAQDDEKLIHYLMRHHHTTPFEQCSIKFHVRVPMDTWRQWIRHRTAKVNEYSTRYSTAIDSAYKTNRWRLQANNNRQGSSDKTLDSLESSLAAMHQVRAQEHAKNAYKALLDLGVARELARKDLPLSTYTEAYWKIDLHNLFHFLHLRLDSHAQWEIRQYAQVIADIAAMWCPVAFEAFRKYRLHALSLSSIERHLISYLLRQDTQGCIFYAEELGWLRKGKTGKLLRIRERDEFEEKLINMEVTIPWR